MTLAAFKAALLTADPNVDRYNSLKEENYTVWHEYGTNDLIAGDSKDESAWKVQIDRYTQIEDDPIVVAISAMLADNGIIPEYQVFPNDPRIGVVRHMWTVEVI